MSPRTILALRVTHAERDQVQAAARRAGLSVSELLRQALRHSVNLNLPRRKHGGRLRRERAA